VALIAGRGQAASPVVRTAATPRLVGVDAAHQRGRDRVVFRFSGGIPSRRTVRYVRQLIADPSGRRLPIAGRAILKVSFFAAAAHTAGGRVTAPGRVAFALPNAMTTVRSGDFESVLSYGIGLAKRTSFDVFTLSRPDRVVIDISARFRTVPRRLYLFNPRRFAANTQPFVTAVPRPVLPATPATALMDRLFAGPTPREKAAGLVLLSSRATGFAGLSVRDQVARVRLTGGCASGGSTSSIADEIMPTLKQLATVRYVKIYDPAGRTERPTGRSDSIPFCLEP
ncbi:MAG TPA: GerMN domain-containing protein, partial [Solirubrobacteraceae bacterium]|nr:GerMN domain-containing protein [Solirubrobacteraceae bacterium]